MGLRPLGAVVDDPPIEQRNSVPRRDRRSRHRPRASDVLAPHRELLHLRRDDERAHRHASDPGRDGSRHVERHRRQPARVIGVFDLVGTLCSGWLTDRYDPRRLLFWYYGLRGLSLLALPFVIGSSNLGLIAFVVFYGLDWVATVPPTVAITAQRVRARAGRGRLRLDLRRPSARRRDRGLGCRRRAHRGSATTSRRS